MMNKKACISRLGKEQTVGIRGTEIVFKCTLHDATKAVPRLTPAGGIWNLKHLMRGALAFPSFVETTAQPDRKEHTD